MKRTFHDLQLSPEDLEARSGQVSQLGSSKSLGGDSGKWCR